MRRYLNTVNIDQVAVGANSGAALTTGTGNILIGPNAGAALTTGAHNVLVGSYDAADRPNLTRNVVLSNGDGTRCFEWDPTGSVMLRLGDAATTPPPTTDGLASLSFDPVTNSMVTSVKHGGVVYQSNTATKASIDALGIVAADTLKVGGADASTLINKVVNTQLATTTAGVSLVQDAATLTLRGLAAAQSGVVVAAAPDGKSVTVGTTFGSATGGPVGATSLVADAAALTVRTLSAGTGVTLIPTGSNVEIVNAAPATQVSLQTLGSDATPNSATLVAGTGVGPNLTMRRVVGGTGVTLTADANTVTVSSGITLATETLVTDAHTLVGQNSGTGGTLRTKGLKGGPGISLSSDGTTVTVENTQTSAGVTLTDAGPVGSVGLTADGTGPSLGVRGLVAGPGMTVVADAVTNAVTITNTAPNTDVTLTTPNVPGSSLILDGTGPSLALRRILAGKGLTSSEDGDVVTTYVNQLQVAAVRPADVVATVGQFSVVPLGTALTLAGWPGDMVPVQFQAVRYAASGGVASHSGALTCGVHGWASDFFKELGFSLDLTVVAPASTPAITFAVELRVPTQKPTVLTPGDTFTGTVSIPAFTAATPCTVSVTGITTGHTGADGTIRPNVLPFVLDTLVPSPLPVYLKLTATTALSQPIDILGMRFSLHL